MEKETIQKLLSNLSLKDKNPQKAKNFRVAIEKSWKTAKFKIIKQGKNFFQFLFEDEAEMIKVLFEGPWCFDDTLLVLKQWNPSLTSDSESFNSVEFWMQLIGLPLYAHTVDVGKKIAVSLKECTFLQIREESASNQLLFRFIACLDISKPLPQILHVQLDEEDAFGSVPEPLIGLFQYERLPSYCYFCGICGHTSRNCPSEEFNLADEENFTYGDR